MKTHTIWNSCVQQLLSKSLKKFRLLLTHKSIVEYQNELIDEKIGTVAKVTMNAASVGSQKMLERIKSAIEMKL